MGKYSDKHICKLWGLFIIILFLVSCAKKDDFKLVIFKEYQNKLLEDIISYKKYEVKMIDKGNYWIMENTSEDMLLDITNITLIKMDIIADNIANEKTTTTTEGGPYVRKILNFSPERGIEVISDTENEHRLVWDPLHPDAIKNGDRQGYVMFPNVDIITEKMDLMAASNLYEVISEYLRIKYKILILR